MDQCLGLKPRGFPVLESLEVGVSKVIQDWNCKSWTSGFVTIFRLLPSFDQSWSLWPNDQHWRGNIYLHHIYIFQRGWNRQPHINIYINRYPLPCLITGWESMFSWCNSHLAIGKSSFFWIYLDICLKHEAPIIIRFTWKFLGPTTGEICEKCPHRWPADGEASGAKSHG